VRYCTNCLQPSTRPNTKFDELGNCPACRYHKTLIDVDWEERFQLLEEMLSRHTKKESQKYDCIVGVSGGKDSTRQALFVRDKLKMNPLLVCMSYPPRQVTDLGAKNIGNLIELGFDIEVIGVSPHAWKKLIREAFLQFGNWGKATEMALFTSVPRLAILYDIPLILWGENPALQVGDEGVSGAAGWDGNNIKNLNTLAGGDIQWMFDAGIDGKELFFFKYPQKVEFEEKKIKIIYLGWFLGDWSFKSNALASTSYGLSIRSDSPENTGDISKVSSLDEDWVLMNQMIKYLKFGFGKTTEFVNEEIRNGRILRAEAITLVEEYDGKCSDKYIQDFCHYIAISRETFDEIISQLTNAELFEPGGTRPRRKFSVGVGTGE